MKLTANQTGRQFVIVGFVISGQGALLAIWFNSQKAKSRFYLEA